MTPPIAAPSRRTLDAIGTRWSVETGHDLSDAARADIAREIAAFDAAWSRFRDDSVVAGLARAGGEVAAPPHTAAMLDLYAELDLATDGAVNPLVGESLARLGYDARLSLVEGSPSAAPAWRDLLRWDDGMLSLATPATIDVGALGKGRLVDLVLEVVRRHASGDVVVDASGDLATRGRAQRVALEHPFHTDRAIGVWEIADQALCASATNRRAWGGGLHHVLDARTGVPVRAYAATWAVADTAMQADALATALFFDGGPQLAHRWGAQWVRMRTDGRVEWSPGCEAELFS
jgi:thiamine biosynthesis lipoprotein